MSVLGNAEADGHAGERVCLRFDQVLSVRDQRECVHVQHNSPRANRHTVSAPVSEREVVGPLVGSILVTRYCLNARDVARSIRSGNVRAPA